MESDFSLIEIAGEDDSLLQQIPAFDDNSTSTNCLFSCSPLQIPGSYRRANFSRVSPTMGSKSNRDVAKSVSSSPACNGNKENINVNKSELPKLSVEPHQMKRRKRGGSSNLRKSLAWDRSFFTEEGVLSSLELSMLSGSIGDSSREVLPTICEDGRKSSGNFCISGDSSDLQGTPQILSDKKGSRAGSKSGCPRPLGFSSLKRPANASTIKGAVKESKIAKLPVSKSGAHSLHKSSKSNFPCTIQAKHNQIGQEDIHSIAGSRSTLKDTKTATSKEKSGSDSVFLSAKPSLQHFRRNNENSAVQCCPSKNLQPQQPLLATRADCGTKASSSGLLPPTGSCATDAHEVSTKKGVSCEKINVAVTMRHTQVQSKKPSGLRMPSPSLGFFNQPKSSGSNSSSNMASQPRNIPGSCVPSSRRHNVSNYTFDSRLLHAPGKMLKNDKIDTASGNAGVSGLRLECVSSSDYDGLHENMKIKSKEKNVMVKEGKVLCHAKSAEVIKENGAEQGTNVGDKGSQESETSCKVGRSCIEKQMDLQKNGDNFHMQGQSSDQLNKNGNNITVACGQFRDFTMSDLENIKFGSQSSCQVLDQGTHETNAASQCQVGSCNQYSSSAGVYETMFESQPEVAAGVIKRDPAQMMHNDSSSTMDDVDEWKMQKNELLNSSAGEAIQIIKITNSMRNDKILLEDRVYFESPKMKREDFANENLKICDSEGSEVLGSNAPPHTSVEQAIRGVAGLDHLCDKLHVEHIQEHFLGENVNNKGCSSEVHDQYLVADNNMKPGEHSKRESPCVLIERGFKLNHDTPLSSNCSLLLESTTAKKNEGLHGLEAALNVISEKGDGRGRKLKYFDVITEDQGANQDDAADVGRTFEQAQLDVALSNSKEMVTSVKDRNCRIKAQIGPDRSSKTTWDHEAGAVTTCNSRALCSLSNEEEVEANGLENYISAEKVETKVLSDNFYKKNEKRKLWDKRILDEYRIRDPIKMMDTSLTNPGSTGSELGSGQIRCLLENTKEVGESGGEIGNMMNELWVGASEVQTLDGSNSRSCCSPMVNQFLVDFADTNVESGGQSVVQTLGVDHICDENHDTLLGDGTSGESQEGYDLSNVLTVREQSVIVQVPLAIEGNGVNVEGVVEELLVDVAPSGSVGTEAFIEHNILSLDTHFESDMMFSGQATYTASDLTSFERGDQTSGLIGAYDEACEREESGFIVQKILTSAESINLVDTAVDKINSMSPAGMEINLSQKTVNPVGEYQHDRDNAICLSEDDNTASSSKRMEEGGMLDNLTIKPPVSAIPFSDEWLAAIEAAGEEMLTIKSGAVQNSPTDKAIPEPGPWSPVKRKQNQIGPFDCTKFINVPSNSD